MNIGYGKAIMHERCQQGMMSSRLLYGIEEIRQKGSYEVIDCSLNDHGGLCSLFLNNLKSIRNAEIVYLSYIYESPLLLLVLLKKMRLIKRTIIGVSHKTILNEGSWLKRLISKWIYSSFDKILFHSHGNMEESIRLQTVNQSQVEFMLWGDDLAFVDRTFPAKLMGDYFISTGRENRDYKVLIEAFANSSWKIEIYTNRIIGENRYDNLGDLPFEFSNIHFQYVDKSNETTLYLAKRLSGCLCVTIPLMKERINYCVGLTSVIEAMAYGKPIISTYNPYFPIDLEKEQIGFFVYSVDDWRRAIDYLVQNPNEAYLMGQRARKLAEDYYNIQQCANQIERIIRELSE